MKRKFVALLLPLVMLIGFVEAKAYTMYGGNFEGKVGKYPIVMSLYLDSSGYVSGDYLYYNAKTGKLRSQNLSLSGSWSRNSNGTYTVKMNEYTPEGRYCGNWSVTVNSSRGSISGAMWNSKNTRYSVSLRRSY